MLLLTYNRERKKSEKWAQKRMKKEEREARWPGRQEHGKEEKRYVHFLKVESFETLMMCIEPVWKEGVFLWAPFFTDSTPRPEIQNNVGKDVRLRWRTRRSTSRLSMTIWSWGTRTSRSRWKRPMWKWGTEW
jgi:hypothetical protein